MRERRHFSRFRTRAFKSPRMIAKNTPETIRISELYMLQVRESTRIRKIDDISQLCSKTLNVHSYSSYSQVLPTSYKVSTNFSTFSAYSARSFTYICFHMLNTPPCIFGTGPSEHIKKTGTHFTATKQSYTYTRTPLHIRVRALPKTDATLASGGSLTPAGIGKARKSGRPLKSKRVYQR